MLQRLDRIGIDFGMGHPHREGEGQFAVVLPPFDKRIGTGQKPLAAGGNPTHAVFGHHARIGKELYGEGRHQCDVGLAAQEILYDGVGIGREQQFGAEITLVPNTMDERHRAEARHSGYTWNCDHRP